MSSDYNTLKYTFIFNLCVIFVFSIIYSVVDESNFQPLNPSDKLTYVDYLFYAITVQTSVGLPDVTALSDLAKILVSIQQLILMGSVFIIISLFLNKRGSN